MFTAADNRHRRGFSLVELLTALAVAALVVPAILAVLPRAFSSLTAAVGAARAARATATFDATFGRDFDSLVPDCGFWGDGARCSFWTLRPTADGAFAPVLVEYRRGQGSVRRAEFPLPLYVSLVGTNAPTATPPDTTGEAPSRQPATEIFAVGVSDFRYGAPAAPGTPELPEWANPTNAPVSVELAFGASGARAARRLFFRRSSP